MKKKKRTSSILPSKYKKKPWRLLLPLFLIVGIVGGGSIFFRSWAESLQTVELEGQVQTVVIDDFQNFESMEEDLLVADDGTSYQMDYKVPRKSFKGSNRVKVRGQVAGESGISVKQLEVISGEEGPPSSHIESSADTHAHSDSPAVAAAITGARKTAVVLFNFNDYTTVSYTQEKARQLIFTQVDSTNNFLKESSFGKISLVGKNRPDGDVFGTYTIPLSRNLKNSSGTCDWPAWIASAKSVANNNGANLVGYDHIVYMAPAAGVCSFGGVAYYPPTALTSFTVISSDDLENRRVVAHEIGHNLNFPHAGAWRCTNPNGVPISISESCAPDSYGDYGDPFTRMGRKNYFQFSNYNKGQAEWISPGTPNSTTVSANGTYSLRPANISSTGTQAIRIPVSLNIPPATVGYDYLLEYRVSTGTFDNFAPTNPVVSGVTIRLAPAYGSRADTRLIDTTPFTPASEDAPLQVGKTFHDSIRGITIKTLSISGGVASVQISFGKDTTPPGIPGIHTSLVKSTQLNLKWAEPTDDLSGVHNYQLSRNDTIIYESIGTEYTDVAVEPGKSYSYVLKTFDNAGNYSSTQTFINVPTVPDLPVLKTGSGLLGNYADSFASPLNFIVTRVDPLVSFDWFDRSPDPSIDPDTFQVQWSGHLEAPETGLYTLYVKGDDGYNLWFDGNLVLDDWRIKAAVTESSAQVAMVAGEKYKLTLNFFENTANASVQLAWQRPGRSREVVPTSALYNGDGSRPVVTSFAATPSSNVFIGENIQFEVAATDNIAVSKVQIKDGSAVLAGAELSNGTVTNGTWSASWKPGSTDVGSKSLTAHVYDTNNLSVSQAIEINVLAKLGDLNGDSLVNALDLSRLLSNYGSQTAAPLDGDLDGNGKIDAADLAVMLSKYLL